MAKAASPKAYRNCSFNKLVDQKIDAAVGPSHSFEVEQRVMVDIYLEKNERMPGRIAKKWDALNVLAQERLYLSKDLAQKVENDIATKVGLSQHRMEVLADIKREHKTQHMNQHYQYTRDLYAADNPNVLRVIKNKDIFLAIDENNVILVFVLSRAVQTLFSEQVVDSIIESSQKWAYLQVVPTQRNDIRHRMEPLDHLRRNPQFDVDAADDSHHAVCGVAHYGCHCPVGHPNGPVYKTRGALCGYQKDYLFHTYPKQILKNRLQHGAFRVVTEVASFCFQNIAPDLRSQYVEACSRTDRDERFDRMKKGEPFTLMAFLANSHTQDHRDSSDWIHGLASLVNVGGDLMFRELGLQVEFTSGSCAAFRGRELYHSTTPWEASTDHGRFCFVLTFGEALRRLAMAEVNISAPVNESESCELDEYHSDLEDTGSPMEGHGTEFLDHLHRFEEEE